VIYQAVIVLNWYIRRSYTFKPGNVLQIVWEFTELIKLNCGPGNSLTDCSSNAELVLQESSKFHLSWLIVSDLLILRQLEMM